MANWILYHLASRSAADVASDRERTFSSLRRLPALPPSRLKKATRVMSAMCHKRIATRLFDNFVGRGEQRLRNFEADQACGLVVDDQLELGRLHHRQVRRLGALENATSVDGSLTPCIGDVAAIAHQSAGLGVI